MLEIYFCLKTQEKSLKEDGIIHIVNNECFIDSQGPYPKTLKEGTFPTVAIPTLYICI